MTFADAVRSRLGVELQVADVFAIRRSRVWPRCSAETPIPARSCGFL